MQYFILFLFALCFSMGLYFILAQVLRIPTYRASKAVISMGKKQKKLARDSDAFLLELAGKLAQALPVEEYKKRKVTALLKSAEIPMTAEVYLALAIVKAACILIFILPCLFIIPILSPIFLVGGIGVYFTETGKAERQVQVRKNEIEYELPRFVATITQELMASRDVLSMLETYLKNVGGPFRHELEITIADMRTGNFEGALTRMEGRISSAMLSDVVRGLIGVLRGDDGTVYFRMLSHDMKQLELQRLKKLAVKRPSKIRKYSLLLLGCMLLIYLGVMGYQIIDTMSGIF